ncbi:MAG: thiamine phosphate synthase [Deltaproteobacteria bacterium]|nr:thiamine phosphate synthase [Deltaproteobacteria bacterium]
MFSSGIYAILDGDRLGLDTPASVRGALPLLTELAVAAREGGAVALQLRLKAVDVTPELRAQVAHALVRAVGDRLPLVINDDVAAATALRSGLHLGQGDGDVAQVRAAVGPAALVGWSTHNMPQVRAAQELPCDYLGFGPILWTGSKRGLDPVTGWAQLTDACAASVKPVVAIGGLGLEHAVLARAAGAHAMAVIGGWLGPAGERASAESSHARLVALVAAWQAGGTA